MPESFIQNYRSLANTDQRRHALDILNAGLNAAATDPALRQKIKLTDSTLTIDTDSYNLDNFDRVLFVGIGKAAIAAAHTITDLLGSRLTDGVVIDTRTDTFPRLRSFKGSHPYPSHDNQAATEAVWELLSQCTTRDLVITVISGGGSALLFRPQQLSCDQVVSLTQALMHHAANIYEMNTVRKHISTIKGGQLAIHAQPATMINLIFSDILDDDLSMVASGPTYLDQTTVTDAWQIVQKYNLDQQLNLSLDCFTETPKNPSLFDHVHNYLIVNNQVAVQAMSAMANSLGYNTRIHSVNLSGEARVVSTQLISLMSQPRTALIAAGETTVTITGPGGTGGRNLEFALGALLDLPNNILATSCASDGIDNAMPAAGALADHITLDTARSAHLNLNHYLSHNDSYSFFEQTDNLIITGPTGINIADLILVLRD